MGRSYFGLKLSLCLCLEPLSNCLKKQQSEQKSFLSNLRNIDCYTINQNISTRGSSSAEQLQFTYDATMSLQNLQRFDLTFETFYDSVVREAKGFYLGERNRVQLRSIGWWCCLQLKTSSDLEALQTKG